MSLDLMSSAFVGASELWRFGTQQRVARGVPIVLQARLEPGGVNPAYTTLRAQGAAAGYAVTVGKTLLVTRVLFWNRTPGEFWTFGYSDADLGVNAGADGANPVNLDPGTIAGAGGWVSVTANVFYDFDVYYEVPAGKYARVAAGAASQALYLRAFGVEV